MHNFKLAAAIGLALVCLSPSLTLAAQGGQPDEHTISMVDDGPALDHGGDPGPLGGGTDDHVNNKRIGDESMIMADGPVTRLGPHLLGCRVTAGHFWFDCKAVEMKAHGLIH